MIETVKKNFFIEYLFKESNKKVDELKEALLKQYMVETIKPITSNIETNLYIGKYDFTDSSPPISKIKINKFLFLL